MTTLRMTAIIGALALASAAPAWAGAYSDPLAAQLYQDRGNPEALTHDFNVYLGRESAAPAPQRCCSSYPTRRSGAYGYSQGFGEDQ